MSKVALKDVEHGGATDITVWDGAASGLLDDDDFARVGASIAPGSLAGILVYENAWAVPLLTALDASTAHLIGWEGIAVDDVLAALGEATTPSGEGCVGRLDRRDGFVEDGLEGGRCGEDGGRDPPADS